METYQQVINNIKLNNYEKMVIKFGKDNDFYFDNNITDALQQKIVNNILNKCKWEKKFQQESKYFYWNNLKLVITSNGIQKCYLEEQSNSWLCKSDGLDFRILIQKEIVLPIDTFPNSIKYETIKYNKRVVYIKNKSIFEINIVKDNDIPTYEFTIYSMNPKEIIQLLEKITLEICNNIKLYNINNNDNVELRSASFNKIKVIN